MKTIYLVEDEILLQELFSEYVHLIPDMEYLGCSGNGQEAVANCLRLKPDVIVLDIRLPEINGLEVLLLLRERLPGTRIIIFSGSVTAQMVKLSQKCAPDAFVEKACGMDELRKAIEAVLRGEQYYTPNVAQLLRAVGGAS